MASTATNTRDTTLPSKSAEFREDINAWRAIALTMVVLFHFKIPGFEGGFIGVDIFLVISGYFMTKIICSDLPNTGLSGRRIARFYLARAQRLLPALAVLCTALMLIAWFYLPSDEYLKLARHSLGSLSFISNIQYWKEVGYFTFASHENFLLHTWSLSLEWQYYLLFPLVIKLIWYIKPNLPLLKLAFIIGIVLSLTLSILLSPAHKTSSFYLLHTRGWEFLLGGMIFFASQQSNIGAGLRRALALFGSTLMAISLYTATTKNPWPSWQAIIPTLGISLVIYANSEFKLLSAAPLQWLGRVSYSGYLWHWPIVAALFYLQIPILNTYKIAGILLTLVLAHCSYHLIELAAQKKFKLGATKSSLLTLGTILAAPIAYASIVAAQDGIRGRLPSHAEQLFDAKNDNVRNRQDCQTGSESERIKCRHGDRNLAGILLGDSHSAALLQALEHSLAEPEQQYILNWSLAACPTIENVVQHYNEEQNCQRHIAEKLRAANAIEGPVPIFISNRYTAYYEGPNELNYDYLHGQPLIGFRDTIGKEKTFKQQYADAIEGTICKLASTKNVYILAPTPEMRINIPRAMGLNALLNNNRRIGISLDDYQARNDEVIAILKSAAAKCGATFLPVTPLLCEAEKCWADLDGKPLYYDDDHLSLSGARLLQPLFKDVLSNND